jgi:hypothetical protein
LDPSEKLLYLYLMTNPLTNIAGVYKITDRRIGFDTGFNLDTIRHIFSKFEKAGKAFRKDEYIIIPSWPKHQMWERSKKLKIGIETILQELDPELIGFLVVIGYRYPIDTIDIPYTYPSNYSDLDLDLDLDSYGVKVGAEDPAPTSPASPLVSPTVIEIETNTGKPYQVTQQEVEFFQETYPAVDIMQELKSMKAWAHSNPRYRKTMKGMPSFINKWLSKHQNQSGINTRYQDNKPRIADSALHPSTSRGPLPTDGKPIVTDFTL